MRDCAPHRPFRLAIVGCGAITDYLHLPAIRLVPDIEVCAAVDINLQQATQVAKKFGISRTATELDEVAADIDGAVITVPPHVKINVAKRAFRHGLHVLCEKPLANTVSDCEQLIEMANAAGRTLAVFHQFRKWPSRRSICDGLKTGALKWPCRVEVSQGSPYSWQSVTGYTVRRDLVSGGVLINAGTHPLDSLISWFGDPVGFEYWDDAFGGLESNVRIKLEFVRGLAVHFRQSRTCTLSNEIRLIYEDHQLVVNNSDPFRIFKRSAGQSQNLTVEASPNGFLEPAAEIYREFTRAARGIGQVEVDGTEATRVIRLIEACYKQKRSRPQFPHALSPGVTW